MIRGLRVLTVFVARLGSTRLPRKLLLPLGEGSVLSTGIERHRGCELVDEFVLATTVNEGDDELAAEAKKLGVPVFRGSEDDVMARMFGAVMSRECPPDLVVRACLDNPLAMPELIDHAIEQLVELDADLLTPFEFNALPFGASAVVLRREALDAMHCDAVDAVHREHVENYAFDHPERFAIAYQRAAEELFHPALSLTLDTEEDHRRLQGYAARLEGVPLEDQLRVLIAAEDAPPAGSRPFWRPPASKCATDSRVGFPDEAAIRTPRVERWSAGDHPAEGETAALFTTLVTDAQGRLGLVDPAEELGRLPDVDPRELWGSWRLHDCRLHHLNARMSPSCRPLTV